jgi:hypothetical protein
MEKIINWNRVLCIADCFYDLKYAKHNFFTAQQL